VVVRPRDRALSSQGRACNLIRAYCASVHLRLFKAALYLPRTPPRHKAGFFYVKSGLGVRLDAILVTRLVEIRLESLICEPVERPHSHHSPSKPRMDLCLQTPDPLKVGIDSELNVRAMSPSDRPSA
jgi:hypothetical protein